MFFLPRGNKPFVGLKCWTNFNLDNTMKRSLKWIGFLTILVCYYLTFNILEAKDNTISYQVKRSDYTFSTVFDMSTEKLSMGSVVKSVFHIKTHYDAYDRFGLYEGQGICRISGLGVLYTWATEIDLYDAEGNEAGMIDGQVVSTEPAKFSFYDAIGQRVAIGYLDQHCMGFTLVDPDNSSFILARLNRNFIQGAVDNWDVIIYHPERISPLQVKVFAAFVCDTQHKFKPDL